MTDGIRQEIEKLERELAKKKAELERIEATCRHNFTDAKYDPVFDKKINTVPDYDAPRMSLVSGPPFKLEDRVEKRDRWTRVCLICGKKEETFLADEQTNVTKLPKF